MLFKQLHILTRYVNDGDDDDDDDQVAKELHPDDGIDEEEHSHEHADVWKCLRINPSLQLPQMRREFIKLYGSHH